MAVHLGEAVEHAIVVQLESGDISSVNCFRKGGRVCKSVWNNYVQIVQF